MQSVGISLIFSRKTLKSVSMPEGQPVGSPSTHAQSEQHASQQQHALLLIQKAGS